MITAAEAKGRWGSGQRLLGIAAVAAMAIAGLWTLRMFFHPIGWATIFAI